MTDQPAVEIKLPTHGCEWEDGIIDGVPIRYRLAVLGDFIVREHWNASAEAWFPCGAQATKAERLAMLIQLWRDEVERRFRAEIKVDRQWLDPYSRMKFCHRREESKGFEEFNRVVAPACCKLRDWCWEARAQLAAVVAAWEALKGKTNGHV